MQAERLVQIGFYIVSHGHVTAKELASYFHVSTRTIYRDTGSICKRNRRRDIPDRRIYHWQVPAVRKGMSARLLGSTLRLLSRKQPVLCSKRGRLILWSSTHLTSGRSSMYHQRTGYLLASSSIIISGGKNMEKWLYVMTIKKGKSYNKVTKAVITRQVADKDNNYLL